MSFKKDGHGGRTGVHKGDALNWRCGVWPTQLTQQILSSDRRRSKTLEADPCHWCCNADVKFVYKTFIHLDILHSPIPNSFSRGFGAQQYWFLWHSNDGIQRLMVCER